MLILNSWDSCCKIPAILNKQLDVTIVWSLSGRNIT